MPDPRTLAETESAMNRHIEGLEIDFAAAQTVSSIYRAANAVRAHITNAVLRQYDLTWSGFVVMWVVWIWDGMETRHVAESAAISKATLTGVMKTLESRGWIIRESSVADRRLVQLRLTQSGIDLMTELYPKFNAAESDVVRQLSARVQGQPGQGPAQHCPHRRGQRRPGARSGCVRRAQRAASMNARKMLACTGSVSAESSGCHWTPRYQPSWPSMVTASIVPSEACAAGRSP